MKQSIKTKIDKSERGLACGPKLAARLRGSEGSVARQGQNAELVGRFSYFERVASYPEDRKAGGTVRPKGSKSP